MTQDLQILSYLKAGNAITPIDALNLFGCFRLAARIFELKDAGWPIECDKIMTDNGKIVGHYTLIQDKKLWPVD
jgi:hypothetical protein